LQRRKFFARPIIKQSKQKERGETMNEFFALKTEEYQGILGTYSKFLLFKKEDGEIKSLLCIGFPVAGQPGSEITYNGNTFTVVSLSELPSQRQPY
jgi:hypothetical protein